MFLGIYSTNCYPLLFTTTNEIQIVITIRQEFSDHKFMHEKLHNCSPKMADTKDESEMPEGEIITLSCADDEEIHQIWDQVDKLRSSGLLCDGVLTVKNKKFPIHKVILAANSDYFRSLFANESNESRACDIEVSGVDLDVMNLILEYVYTRKVEITMENVFNVLPVADLFHLDGLTRACCALLISELRPNNCIGIMKYGEKSGKSDLAETARKYVLDNFQQVATGSKEFLDLSVGSLADIVGDDCLTTRTEEDVRSSSSSSSFLFTFFCAPLISSMHSLFFFLPVLPFLLPSIFIFFLPFLLVSFQFYPFFLFFFLLPSFLCVCNPCSLPKPGVRGHHALGGLRGRRACGRRAQPPPPGTDGARAAHLLPGQHRGPSLRQGQPWLRRAH